MKKFLITLTEEQLMALHDSASKQGVTANELVRQCLINANIIPDAEINRGGYRERKNISSDDKNSA